MKKTSLKKIWEMFFYFFRISWFTFGGGWSIVAQMQKDFVDDKKELTAEELLDIDTKEDLETLQRRILNDP